MLRRAKCSKIENVAPKEEETLLALECNRLTVASLSFEGN